MYDAYFWNCLIYFQKRGIDKKRLTMRRRKVSKKYLRKRWGFLSQDKNGVLMVEGLSVEYLAKKYGTPVYLLVESEIRNRLRRFKAAFPYKKLRPQYACKCNSNLEILKIVREEGFELDASSVGEIILGLLADYQPEQITFTNLYKTEQDIAFATKVGVQAITIDSVEELERAARVGQRLGIPVRIFLRFNPMISFGHYSCENIQYGIPGNQAKKAFSIVKGSEFLLLKGLHFHGGYMPSPKVYFVAAKKMLKFAKIATDMGMPIDFVDLGGGFPVAYGAKKIFTPEEMGKRFSKFFERYATKLGIEPPTLIFEPGKFIVANAGLGLVKVISKKKLKNRTIIIVDGSTYAFVPDPLIYKCYYDILPATDMDKRRTKVFTIAGCTCDCIDIIGNKRKLPDLHEGDLLSIMDTGAYSNVMASNFNTLRRAPMVMIKESGISKIIRRRDRYSEMFAPELDVLKMADPKELKNLYNMYRVNMNKIWRDDTNNSKQVPANKSE